MKGRMLLFKRLEGNEEYESCERWFISGFICGITLELDQYDHDGEDLAVELNTTSALANYATEAGKKCEDTLPVNFGYDVITTCSIELTLEDQIDCQVLSSPVASLVLTDSSQLTADGFEKLPDQIMYPYAEP
uniref:Tectonic-1-3 domain-containing protein n=1 Tax=Timema shepardi TaxID=629360 RepID=A0A7R9AW06_TIMSH|nr:unnamed protein product [Timema shepardi]